MSPKPVSQPAPRADEGRACVLRAITLLALPAMLALASPAAQAVVVRCVSTPAEIESAFVEADDEDLVLAVVRGTYDVTGRCLDSTQAGRDDCIHEADLRILGGHAPGCGSRTLDAADTVFTRPGGSISTPGGDREFLELSSLTVRNANQVSLRAADFYAETEVLIQRVHFDQVGTVLVGDSDEVRVRNSAFTRATGTCAVRFGRSLISGRRDPLELLVLDQVTIANATGDGLCAGTNDGDLQGSNWSLTARNSIFWGNAGTNIVLRQADIAQIPATFKNNTYGGTIDSNVPLTQAPTGTLNSNPQFVNAATGDFELGGASPSINTGLILPSSVGDVDLRGDARMFSTGPDRGAWESAIGSTATTITVTANGNSGLGTLRQAILDANAAPNYNRIHFDMPGACPRVINLSTDLPEITAPLLIDGYTQDGSSRNTLFAGSNANLCVILLSVPPSGPITGLTVSSAAPESVNVRIEGLGFSNFVLAAVSFIGGGEHAIYGSQFGGTINGNYNALPNGYGVQIGLEADGMVVGGPDPDQRNVFADSLLAGVGVFGDFNRVENNYIGFEANGSTAAGGDKGIRVLGDYNTLVGNLIGNNAEEGIELDDARFNTVTGNRIGTSALCVVGTCPRGNGTDGVGAHGTNAVYNKIYNNTIVNNAEDGVAVRNGASLTTIWNNVMYDNASLGIELGQNGSNANDNDYNTPPASAGNRNLNVPIITSATGTDANAFISGSFSSTNGVYVIDFYADSACPDPPATGQGRFPLTSAIVEITNADGVNNGTVAFSNVRVSRPGNSNFFAAPRGIFATASRATSVGVGAPPARSYTSEFSRCRNYVNTGELFADGFEP